MSQPVASIESCATCGEPVGREAACSFCSAPSAQAVSTPAPRERVRHRATEWARRVFGAPYRFPDLVREVRIGDEQFHRVFTVIARREVREVRVPTTASRSEAQRLDPRTVDPFSISTDALRASSEHVTGCAPCTASGTEVCSDCAGSSRMACPRCGGSGQELRQYRKSSRWVKCSVCRAAGRVDCGRCLGRGRVTCRGCAGSGHQLAWLTYDETSRACTAIVPDSPVFAAHPQLREQRPLAPSDLGDFGVVFMQEARGLVRPAPEMDRALFAAQTSTLDRRLERVGYQQYAVIASVRRDAVYEMCGSRGVLVLSGLSLVPSGIRESSAPIRRRLFAWVALSALLIASTALMVGSLTGATRYFARSNGWLSAALCAFAVLAIAFIGAPLRALRPGFRWGGLRLYERGLGLGAFVSLLGGLLVAWIGRPTVAEANRALAADDLARAREVVEALHWTSGNAADVLEVDDALAIAEAPGRSGEEKLALLDRVAARAGSRAAEAAAGARGERLAELRHVMDDGHFAEAVAAIDRWWPGTWPSDSEVAQLRAEAEDGSYDACSDDPCRYAAAANANAAMPSADRESVATAARDRLFADLRFPDVPTQSALSRLQNLRALAATATAAKAVAGADQDVEKDATAAMTLAERERAKVAIVGADEAIAVELLGDLASHGPNIDNKEIDGVLVSFSLDQERKCRGMYLVGVKAPRSLSRSSPTVARLLSQAVGHAAAIKPATAGTNASRWLEGAIPIMARWTGQSLVELRIGDATP